MTNCRHCGHDKSEHGPTNAHWEGTILVQGPGTNPLGGCFEAENRGYQEDFCSCPGYAPVKYGYGGFGGS